MQHAQPSATKDVAPAAATAAAPAEAPELPPGLWAKTKHLVVHNILHLDDTPHRIAFGVFLGFVVGATPTIGLQMIIYVTLAAIVGANKVSGILPVWLSNPVTAVPLYYSNWRIGRFLLGGEADSEASQRMLEQVIGVPGQDLPLWERLFSLSFWEAAFEAFMAMGAELWVGSLLVGVVAGAAGYWATYRGVIGFRARRKAA